MHTTTRGRRLAALATVTVLGLGAVSTAGSAAVPGGTGATTTSSYCGLTWGSLARTTPAASTTGTLSAVRSGRHTCYDRVVVDVADVPGTLRYDVRYVSSVREDGSGRAVPLLGGADLRVILRAPAYDEDGRATYRPADRSHLVDVEGYRTFRQVAWAGSFEGQTTMGLGVRARLPFRAFVLEGPGAGARLVIDVAHRW